MNEQRVIVVVTDSHDARVFRSTYDGRRETEEISLPPGGADHFLAKVDFYARESTLIDPARASEPTVAHEIHQAVQRMQAYGNEGRL